MSQEFRLSIKNFSQRKIVNVKDIFKNLTEAEKEILEREKRRAEEKALRDQELVNNRLISSRSKTTQFHVANQATSLASKQPPVNIIRRAKHLEDKKSQDLSKSSNQIPTKLNEINNNISNLNTNNNNINRSNKSNKSKNNLIYAYEPNEEKNSYEENYKRYINQIDLNLNRILNEKKLNKNDFELIHKMSAKKPSKPSPNDNNNKIIINNIKKEDYPMFRRPENHSERIWVDNNEKLNKFNGFKKKIKNLFASDEYIDNLDNNLNAKKFDDHGPVRIIQINNNNKEPKCNKSQFFDNDLNDVLYLEPNLKWNNINVNNNNSNNNNYNKNFKYKPPKNLTNDIMLTNRYNQSNDAFPSDTKFRKLSNLINRTKNLLH